MSCIAETISIAVRPRQFIEGVSLPPLARARLYDPAAKPRGLGRLRRKLGQAAEDVVHGWLKIPARGAITVRMADGSSTRLDFDAHQSAYLAFASRAVHGGYDVVETMFLDTMLPKAGVFYDVGANWGYYTLLAATHPGFEGRVYAFDVSPRMNEALTGMARTMGLEAVEVAGYGLSDRNGYAGTTTGKAAHLTKVIAAPAGNSASGARALVRRLDDVALPPPDLMKIDVEGHEQAVFEGGRRILTDHRPLVLFECCGDGPGRQAMALVRSLGYSVYGLRPRDAADRIELRPAADGDISDGVQVNLVAVAAGDEARWFA